MDNQELYDITIIGAGPTGLFGAFYAGMRRLKTKIIEALPEAGGQLGVLYPEKLIYDVPGYYEIKAKDLTRELVRQIMRFPVTLCFEEQVEALGALLRDVVAGMMPFVLEARGIGAFPNPRAPRVIWLGLQGAPEAMASLHRMHAGIEDGVAGLGFPRESRAFTAHLTLARVRDRQSGAALAKVLEANRDRAVGSFTAASVGLIKSELRPAGAVYTTLVEVPFGAGV